MRARHPRRAGSDRGELRALASRSTSTAAGPYATCRQPSSRAAGFGARLCSLFHDRRFASLAVTEKTPVGFFFHRLVICLNSAGNPARPQVSFSCVSFSWRTVRVFLFVSWLSSLARRRSVSRQLIDRLSYARRWSVGCSLRVFRRAIEYQAHRRYCRDPEADEAPCEC